MSGFFGMLRQDGAPVDERFLRDIAEELRFRGPDRASVWCEKGIGACFTLMRTGPAPQAEYQPEETGPFRLWGDIRLDGREELRRELDEDAQPGDAVASSEALFLKGWQKWGAAALERVIGDFAVALWDDTQQTLWCARDFVGARPFYYAYAGPVFCFSNTLDILRRVPGVSKELDEQYVGDFLLEGWSMEPSRTVYRDIRRLPAGHLLQFAKGQKTVRRFQKLPLEEPLRLSRAEEYVERFLALWKAAVKDRLPTGATSLYLSGGLDSSAVCAMASRLAADCGKQTLKAFTVSWKPFLADEEADLAKLTARHLGIAHEILGPGDLVPFRQGEIGEGKTPEPTLEPHLATSQRHYRRIATHSNVVLSGDGGDDALTGQAWPYLVHLWKRREWRTLLDDFGGYFRKHRKIPPLRGGFRTRFAQLFRGDGSFEEYPPWLNEDFELRANLPERWLEFRNQNKAPEHPTHPRAYEGLHSSYWSAVLETEDAGWSRVNLETRAPFLDLRVLQYFLRLPPVPWCVNKELCRCAMRGFLPRAVLNRPKTPLAKDAIDMVGLKDWRVSLPKEVPVELKRFVNWGKWCETFQRPKGSLSWLDLRPLSLSKWLESR